MCDIAPVAAEAVMGTSVIHELIVIHELLMLERQRQTATKTLSGPSFAPGLCDSSESM